MPKVLCIYLDDSGTRNPDHNLSKEIMYRDWFTLGGYLSYEEDEGVIRTAHAKFCETWGINYPLHSYDIRSETKNFTWLRALEEREKRRFFRDLSEMLLGIPIIGHASVVDRPGYNARYREQYGRQTWDLCKTAFSVICERAAKRARSENRKLRVYVEEGDKSADDKIREYYATLRANGMPFAGATSAKYAPLSAAELKDTLYDLDFKAKTSPMAQVADLYAYPIARGGYDPEYFPYRQLWDRKRLIDSLLSEEEIPHLGVKYSCFETIDKNKKSRR
jgi:hypothetical protein